MQRHSVRQRSGVTRKPPSIASLQQPSAGTLTYLALSKFNVKGVGPGHSLAFGRGEAATPERMAPGWAPPCPGSSPRRALAVKAQVGSRVNGHHVTQQINNKYPANYAVSIWLLCANYTFTQFQKGGGSGYGERPGAELLWATSSEKSVQKHCILNF